MKAAVSQRMACTKERLTDVGSASFRVRDNAVSCAQCGKWINGRCAGVKRVSPK